MEDQFKFQVDPNDNIDAKTREGVGNSKHPPKVVMILGIFMVCLALLTISGFIYLNQRLKSTLSSKTQAVDTLSQNLEDRFSSLSVKQARLEATLAEQIKSTSRKITDLETTVQKEREKSDARHAKTEQTVATKIDPKQLQKAVTVIEKRLSALNADLTDLADQADQEREKSRALTSSLNDQLNEFEIILNETAKSVIALKTELTDLAGNQLDKNAMGGEIKRQLGPTHKKIGQFNATAEILTERLQSLQKSVTTLQQNSDIHEREILRLRGLMNDLQRQLNTRPLPTEELQ